MFWLSPSQVLGHPLSNTQYCRSFLLTLVPLSFTSPCLPLSMHFSLFISFCLLSSFTFLHLLLSSYLSLYTAFYSSLAAYLFLSFFSIISHCSDLSSHFSPLTLLLSSHDWDGRVINGQQSTDHHRRWRPQGLCIDDQQKPLQDIASAENLVEFTIQPHQWQLKGAAQIHCLCQSNFQGGICGDAMGLGKTILAILAIHLVREEQSGFSLVVCPASCKLQWAKAIEGT